MSGNRRDDLANDFRIFSAKEFCELEPQSWIIKNVLPQAELAVIYGESGSGKSFFMLDMMTAIARGQSWQGLRVSQGRVVIVAAEGAGGFKKRLLAHARHYEFDMAKLDLGVIQQPPNLMTNDDVFLGDAIQASGGAKVVVIDTLAASMPGGNENSSEDMGRVLANCRRLHDFTGALVVLIHHAGKDAERGARGWSGLRAAADAEIYISRSMEHRIAKVSKLKDGQDGAEFAFKLRRVVVGFDQDGDPIDTCVLSFDPTFVRSEPVKRPAGAWQKAVFKTANEMLKNKPAVSSDDLVNAAAESMPASLDSKGRDRRREQAMRALDGLVATGLLMAKNGGFIHLPQNPQTRELWDSGI